MTQKEEAAYMNGRKTAWLTILKDALEGLGYDGPEFHAAKWAVERAEIVAMLRYVCGRHGDNDWPDDLNLADVIDKHLNKHLG